MINWKSCDGSGRGLLSLFIFICLGRQRKMRVRPEYETFRYIPKLYDYESGTPAAVPHRPVPLPCVVRPFFHRGDATAIRPKKKKCRLHIIPAIMWLSVLLTWFSNIKTSSLQTVAD
jgi:hypothetical protein